MRQHSKSSLFLMELIIAILFFAVSSALCIQLFVYAHNKTQASRDLNFAMTQCESAAELYRASEGDFGALASSLQAQQNAGGAAVCYFSAQGMAAPSGAAAYEMALRETRDGGLSTLVIEVYTLSSEQPSAPVYTMTVSVHPPYTAQKEAV
ncbi:MAG: hypothetical protein Q4G07_01425 [Oscillospiraceae bacterium]|nr:hypothetical protein [Oscillospiraceae bacterium]